MALQPIFLFDAEQAFLDGQIGENGPVHRDLNRLTEMFFNGRRDKYHRWEPVLDRQDFPDLAVYLENETGYGVVPILIYW